MALLSDDPCHDLRNRENDQHQAHRINWLSWTMRLCGRIDNWALGCICLAVAGSAIALTGCRDSQWKRYAAAPQTTKHTGSPIR